MLQIRRCKGRSASSEASGAELLLYVILNLSSICYSRDIFLSLAFSDTFTYTPEKQQIQRRKKTRCNHLNQKKYLLTHPVVAKGKKKKEPLKFSTEIVSLAWPPQALIRKSISKVYPLETLEEFPLWLWKKILNNLIRELDVLRKKLFSLISEDMPHFQV